jgi:SAM-dependent methyltransferase
VYGVEPNDAMRRAAEALLGCEERFHSVPGTAEATRLPDASVDLVTAGQAFHWFDRARFRAEADRILRPGGRVALFWNRRRTDSTPFLRAYEELLLRYGTDYTKVDHARLGPDDFAAFFGGPYTSHHFPNEQRFDFEGLLGRLLSSSYAPGFGHPSHEPMLGALRELFDAHQEGGEVRFEYDTELYFA